MRKRLASKILIAIAAIGSVICGKPMARADGPGSASAIEQISGNAQVLMQSGANNTATVTQSAVANGHASGGNDATVVQHGNGNSADLTQRGEALSASISQSGHDNMVGLDQSGAGLAVRVEQHGNGHAVGVRQTGFGTGAPVTVRQY